MNKVILMGRLTRDPQVRYTQGQDPMAIARFTLAVDRRGRKQEGQQDADFPSCVAFGKSAEFVEKYVHQGTKIVLTGRIQTGSYTNKEGQKANPANFLLMHAMGPNVAGVIGSAIAAGFLLSVFSKMI